MVLENPKILQLQSTDNVAVAMNGLSPGDSLDIGSAVSKGSIPAGHKVAVCGIKANMPVYKYGQVIGYASQDIQAGQHVHDHNVTMGRVERNYEFGIGSRTPESATEVQQEEFKGIVRPNGQVATRNFIGVLSTVSCSSSVARFIADEIRKEIAEKYPHVDGIVALGHSAGCCHNPESDGLVYLQRVLSGYAQHPNFGGVLLVGLGCEVNHLDCFMEATGLSAGPLMKSIDIQKAGGTNATVKAGVRAIIDMLPVVNTVRRQPVSAEHIILGLECGGSDAYSGISANPALGKAVDLLVAQGGTAILSETPEIYGAEHLLARRAVDSHTARKLIRRIKWWEDYTARHGGEINNNPTSGNKEGGITTILEKSLGAVAKGGSSPLQNVYTYAEKVSQSGLVFMDSPGYDVVSITGMIAAGANVVCFTTGRGTVVGFNPVPTIKLASNTPLYQHMVDDMDINCGQIIDGKVDIDEMGDTIFQNILAAASGHPVKSERFGYGEAEFVPWPIGAVM
jgi:altronate dehydratase